MNQRAHTVADGAGHAVKYLGVGTLQDTFDYELQNFADYLLTSAKWDGLLLGNCWKSQRVIMKTCLNEATPLRNVHVLDLM